MKGLRSCQQVDGVTLACIPQAMAEKHAPALLLLQSNRAVKALGLSIWGVGSSLQCMETLGRLYL
jgi:hypothetical protein